MELPLTDTIKSELYNYPCPGILILLFSDFSIILSISQNMHHMIKLDQYMARHNLLQSLIRLTQYSLNQVSSEYETLSVLYFNTTIFKIIKNLSLQQIQSTQLTANTIIKLLNVCYIYSNSAIKYCASDIILHVDSDASYLSFPRLVFAQDITIISYLNLFTNLCTNHD